MTTIDKQLVGYLKDAHALQEHVEATLSELLTTLADEPDICRRLGRYAERTRLHTRRSTRGCGRTARPRPSSGTRGSCSPPCWRPGWAAAAATR